ncbi:MAG: translation elongation factor Ts [Pseudanabaenaceae cyanobacterium bins.39]|nr:translation elongation factor Ts [Pseudanabaenaceae cyanobacterium bins.39]
MAEITNEQVKDLRARTGAGIKDCKSALIDSDGDFAKAIEYLRQKGLASAVKKASRAATEGIVHSYIHFGSRIGVLVEVNCETDFVARREELKELADSVAKQIAACPNVEYVSVADVPAEFVEKEKQIEAGKDDLASKPAAIRDKIVLGRIEKRLKELSLLDQPYIKDQSITVDELVKQTGAKLSENVKVRRFVRFVVGEDSGAEAAE